LKKERKKNNIKVIDINFKTKKEKEIIKYYPDISEEDIKHFKNMNSEDSEQLKSIIKLIKDRIKSNNNNNTKLNEWVDKIDSLVLFLYKSSSLLKREIDESLIHSDSDSDDPFITSKSSPNVNKTLFSYELNPDEGNPDDGDFDDTNYN
jgi:hypothetical protein